MSATDKPPFPDQMGRLRNALLVLGMRMEDYVSHYNMAHHVRVTADIDGVTRFMVDLEIVAIEWLTDEALLQMVVDAVAEQEYRVRSI